MNEQTNLLPAGVLSPRDVLEKLAKASVCQPENESRFVRVPRKPISPDEVNSVFELFRVA